MFGWQFKLDESLPIEYYRIETPSIMGGLLKRPAQTPPMEYGTNAFTCSVQVENFDEVAAKILAQGKIVAMDKFAIPGRLAWLLCRFRPQRFGIFKSMKMQLKDFI